MLDPYQQTVESAMLDLRGRGCRAGMALTGRAVSRLKGDKTTRSSESHGRRLKILPRLPVSASSGGKVTAARHTFITQIISQLKKSSGEKAEIESRRERAVSWSPPSWWFELQALPINVLCLKGGIN